MVIAAFTFGAFGDITSIISLAWTIRRSLSEAAGASAQIQTLITDIDSFMRALQQIKTALPSHESLQPDLANGIAFALETCFQILQRVKRRIDSFQAGSSGAFGMAIWRKCRTACAWEILGGRHEVEALKSRMFEQINIVETLLAASHRYAVHRLQMFDLRLVFSQRTDQLAKQARENQIETGDMFRRLEDSFCQRLATMSASFVFFDAGGAQLLPIAVIPYEVYSSVPEMASGLDSDLGVGRRASVWDIWLGSLPR